VACSKKSTKAGPCNCFHPEGRQPGPCLLFNHQSTRPCFPLGQPSHARSSAFSSPSSLVHAASVTPSRPSLEPGYCSPDRVICIIVRFTRYADCPTRPTRPTASGLARLLFEPLAHRLARECCFTCTRCGPPDPPLLPRQHPGGAVLVGRSCRRRLARLSRARADHMTAIAPTGSQSSRPFVPVPRHTPCLRSRAPS